MIPFEKIKYFYSKNSDKIFTRSKFASYLSLERNASVKGVNVFLSADRMKIVMLSLENTRKWLFFEGESSVRD